MDRLIQYARAEDGVRIAYWTLGKGAPLVYLAGGGLGTISSFGMSLSVGHGTSSWLRRGRSSATTYVGQGSQNEMFPTSPWTPIFATLKR